MKISIITIVYNNKNNIEACIQSVLHQTYTNIEHIIIDGGSTDGTQQIIERYRHKLACYISEKDSGLYNALNKGIRKATGDIIGILISDDFDASNNIIKNVLKVFEETGCDAVYGNLDFVDPNYTNKVIRHWKSSPYKTGSFKTGWHPPHPPFFVKKDISPKPPWRASASRASRPPASI